MVLDRKRADGSRSRGSSAYVNDYALLPNPQRIPQ